MIVITTPYSFRQLQKAQPAIKERIAVGGRSNAESYGFLSELESIITDRRENASAETSYVSELFEKGINKIAQKVGEEAVEVVIEAKDAQR